MLRPDGAVQVGWDPRRAVLVRPPRGLAAAALAALLRSMRSPLPITELQRQAVERGLSDTGGLDHLVTQLVSSGVATRGFRADRWPGRLDPGPRPRAAVGPADGGTALFGSAYSAQ